jgi:hypothetical protein
MKYRSLTIVVLLIWEELSIRIHQNFQISYLKFSKESQQNDKECILIMTTINWMLIGSIAS